MTQSEIHRDSLLSMPEGESHRMLSACQLSSQCSEVRLSAFFNVFDRVGHPTKLLFSLLRITLARDSATASD